VKRTWRESSLAADLKGYVEKALEMGISFHRDPFRERGGGLVYREFEGWMKGILGRKLLSLFLKRLFGGGLLGGGSSFTGNPGRYKSIRMRGSHSMGAPLHRRGTWYVGGSYTGDFDR
jgi:hypothetical protein